MTDKKLKTERQRIIEALELKPWDVWEAIKLEENEKHNREVSPHGHQIGKDRQTGRTTRVMVSALVAMTRGLKVTILSHRYRGYQKPLLHRLRDMAGQLGLNQKLVVKKDADVEFCDHSYYE